jgi:hypothetical protein
MKFQSDKHFVPYRLARSLSTRLFRIGDGLFRAAGVGARSGDILRLEADGASLCRRSDETPHPKSFSRSALNSSRRTTERRQSRGGGSVRTARRIGDCSGTGAHTVD